MDPISKEFVGEMEQFAQDHDIAMMQFRKGKRKDDIAAEHLKSFEPEDGVLFIGSGRDARLPD